MTQLQPFLVKIISLTSHTPHPIRILSNEKSSRLTEWLISLPCNIQKYIKIIL